MAKPTYEELERRVRDLEKEDIGRKQAEEALRVSEKRWNAMIDATTTETMVLLDREGIVYMANQTVCDRLGTSKEELVGKRLYDFFPPDVAESRRKKFDEIFNMGKPVSFEDSRGGMTFEHMACLISGVGDQGEMVVSFAKEISERKQAAEAVRNSEAKYRSVFENTGTATIIVEDDMLITLANTQFVKLSGYSKEEIEDKMRCIDFFVEEERERLKGYHAKRRKNGERVPSEYESKLVDKDGNIKDLFLKVGIIPGTKKSICSLTDMTWRKRMELALEEEKERFRVLVERSPFGVSFISKDGQYKYLNPKFIEIFGYTLEDIPAGREWFRKAYPDKAYRKQVISMWIQSVEECKVGELRPYIFYVMCRDGSKRTIHFRPVTMVQSGDQFVVTEDITRQRQMEEEKKKLEFQLQQAQKMEAIGTLAGGIAHDFNNLLMAIQGRASILLMHKDPSHPDFEPLRGIESYIESAADLTRQLLGFARGGKYEVRSTDLNKLIKKENGMIGRTRKEITIRGTYEKNLWSVEVDKGQVQQVLLNLYVNALQAMPVRGDLYIKTQNVTVDENYTKPYQVEPGKYVQISVTDTGVGMDKATQDRMFDPFFTTKKMGRGTGLGLASAYGIIKNHGGFINVYSEKGHGTTFNIYLPASEKEVIEEKESTGDILMGSETLLFIDDEDMIIEIAEDMLGLLGYKVLAARSGKEAIEIYQKNKEQIDIVVLDMVMPDMNGGETYDRIKDINPDVKTLLSSGYSINGQATEILNRGCNGFIQKPFKMKELSQKLKGILDER